MLYSQGIYSDKILISIGNDCQPTWRLRQFNLRQIAYPFDWLRTYNFDGLCTCIHENFKFFLTIDDLIHQGYGLRNRRYGIEFVHDFPTIEGQPVALENENAGTVVSNYCDYLPEMNNKYNPRIQRFLESLTSTNEVIFFRTHIGPHDAQKFVAVMQKYPNLNYTLAVIHGNKSLRHNWNIPHTMSFYAEKLDSSSVNGWWHETEWFDIFTALNIGVAPIA